MISPDKLSPATFYSPISLAKRSLASTVAVAALPSEDEAGETRGEQP